MPLCLSQSRYELDSVWGRPYKLINLFLRKECAISETEQRHI